MKALVAILAVVAVQSTSSSGIHQELLPAKLLTRECTVERHPIGLGFSLGAWLTCDKNSILLTHPLNLVDQVRIQTEGDALEYVRLFSSRPTHRLFPDFGRVEILPADESGPYVLSQDEFRKIATPALVERVEASQGTRRSFIVTRAVVFLDDLNLYKTVEIVHDNGLWELVSKELLFENVADMGLIPLSH